MTTPSNAVSRCLQTLMGWGIKGVDFLGASPKAFEQIGKEGATLLKDFRYQNEVISGEIEAKKVRELVQRVADFANGFLCVGVALTCASYLASYSVSIFPIIPSLLRLLSLGLGVITYEVFILSSKVESAHARFNAMHLDKVQKGEIAKVSFECMVETIDSYGREAFVGVRLLRRVPGMKDSLTHWRPLLTEIVENQKGEGEGESSTYAVLKKHFPILPAALWASRLFKRV